MKLCGKSGKEQSLRCRILRYEILNKCFDFLNEMAASAQNFELEAAKFLHKLIQDSTYEPVKLATKLHVILLHMKSSSGKEQSMPCQVILRNSEGVVSKLQL